MKSLSASDFFSLECFDKNIEFCLLTDTERNSSSIDMKSVFMSSTIESIKRLKISCLLLIFNRSRFVSYAGIVRKLEGYFFVTLRRLNWILIKRQIKLKECSHTRDIELKFPERNWLIGLFLSEYLLGFDERNSVELLTSIRCRLSQRERRFKFPSKVFAFNDCSTHFQHADDWSSKNKAIDAGTQYSGRK